MALHEGSTTTAICFRVCWMRDSTARWSRSVSTGAWSAARRRQARTRASPRAGGRWSNSWRMRTTGQCSPGKMMQSEDSIVQSSSVDSSCCRRPTTAGWRRCPAVSWSKWSTAVSREAISGSPVRQTGFGVYGTSTWRSDTARTISTPPRGMPSNSSMSTLSIGTSRTWRTDSSQSMRTNSPVSGRLRLSSSTSTKQTCRAGHRCGSRCSREFRQQGAQGWACHESPRLLSSCG